MYLADNTAESMGVRAFPFLFFRFPLGYGVGKSESHGLSIESKKGRMVDA